ncbi:MAG TPA: hypothetical protein VHJ99_09975 [Candidatus Dormibacteraeota bacterium]|nr:hypothetical protein [Candidatus Dormibacteraeota bacterium]
MSATPSEIENSPVELDRPAQAAGPWYPPPSYPPPKAQSSGSTDARAIAALLAAIAGIILGLPLGIPGMVLGTVAYFLGTSSVRRIDSSQGAVGGRGLAVSAWVLGVVAMAIGSIVTLTWLVVLLLAISQPASTG